MTAEKRITTATLRALHIASLQLDRISSLENGAEHYLLPCRRAPDDQDGLELVCPTRQHEDRPPGIWAMHDGNQMQHMKLNHEHVVNMDSGAIQSGHSP